MEPLPPPGECSPGLGRALDGATLSRPIKHFQLRHDNLLDQDIRLGGEGVPIVVLLEDLDAGPVYQERVVHDQEVVVEHAERVALKKIHDSACYCDEF